MKKKVLFVITKSNWGGAQRYVFELATTLPRDRFEVAVALGGSGDLIQKLRVEHIRILPISSLTRDVKTLSDISAFFELWAMFRKEKPDIVHLNSAKAGGVGALAARFARVHKVIFTAHGWAFNEERPLWQRLIIKFFSWITILLSSKTIAVSDAVKNNIKDWPLIAQKISVIKNGVRELEFHPHEEARNRLFAQAHATVPANAFLIGTIAELHKSKGLRYAIEAFSKIAGKNPLLYYFILGGGEEKESLNALVEHYGLQERIFLIGFVDDAARFLKAFEVFILPSITEGLGFVLLEAGLAELPVIASSVGGIPEIIDDTKTGLLTPPRDVNALIRALEWMIENPEERNVLGSVLREKVLRKFSLASMSTETVALYEEK